MKTEKFDHLCEVTKSGKTFPVWFANKTYDELRSEISELALDGITVEKKAVARRKFYGKSLRVK